MNFSKINKILFNLIIICFVSIIFIKYIAESSTTVLAIEINNLKSQNIKNNENVSQDKENIDNNLSETTGNNVSKNDTQTQQKQDTNNTSSKNNSQSATNKNTSNVNTQSNTTSSSNNSNTNTNSSTKVKVDSTKFYYTKIPLEVKNRMMGKSYPSNLENVKITLDELRYVRVSYYDFNSVLHDDGELIVNVKVADDIIQIFYELYLLKYPFREISLIDKYGASDELSMQNNNTSSFNYRNTTDSNTLSKHALGLAIDINPLYNPYISNDTFYPANSSIYLDRTKDFSGKIDKNDDCYKIFTKYGWSWGGNWKYIKDYQHFEKKI